LTLSSSQIFLVSLGKCDYKEPVLDIEPLEYKNDEIEKVGKGIGISGRNRCNERDELC
jgi:hypothetical protein